MKSDQVSEHSSLNRLPALIAAGVAGLASLQIPEVRDTTLSIGVAAANLLVPSAKGGEVCEYSFNTPIPVNGASTIGINEAWPTKSSEGMIFTEATGDTYRQKFLPEGGVTASYITVTGLPNADRTEGAQFVDRSTILLRDPGSGDYYQVTDTSGGAWTSGVATLSLEHSAERTGLIAFDQNSGEIFYTTWNSPSYDISKDDGTPIANSAFLDEIEPSSDSTNTDGERIFFAVNDADSNCSAGCEVWVKNLETGCTQQLIPEGARSPYFDQTNGTLYFAKMNESGDFDIYSQRETIEDNTSETVNGVTITGIAGDFSTITYNVEGNVVTVNIPNGTRARVITPEDMRAVIIAEGNGGNIKAKLDTNSGADVGAGVIAEAVSDEATPPYNTTQACVSNQCDDMDKDGENDDQRCNLDTEDQESAVQIWALNGQVILSGEIDLQEMVLPPGEQAAFSDTLLCQPQEDTGHIDTGDTQDTHDTSVTHDDTSGEALDSQDSAVTRDTGIPSGGCACASTPNEQGTPSLASTLMVAAALLGAYRKKRN